jgi:cytoskeletal protein RodZ
MERMQKLGDLLMQMREQKELTIKEASSATKIRESMLEALESGDYAGFSSDTHLKSFIKAYAKFLGINEDKALAMYRRERRISFDQEAELTEKTSKNYSASGFFSLVFNFRTLIGIVFGVILLLAVYFFYSQWISFSEPPSLVILGPDQNTTLTQQEFVIEGLTDSASVKIFVDGNQGNFIDSKGRFKVNAKFAEPGTKRFTIIAQNDFKKTEYTLDLKYQPEETKVVTQKVKIVNNGIKASTLNYSKDSKPIFENATIQPNGFIEIEFSQKIEFKNFDEASMNLYLNNDLNPIEAIDSKEFSIMITGNYLFFKSKL